MSPRSSQKPQSIVHEPTTSLSGANQSTWFLLALLLPCPPHALQPNARPQPSPRTPRRSKSGQLCEAGGGQGWRRYNKEAGMLTAVRSEEHHAIPLNGGAMKIFSGHQGEHSQTADLVFDSCSPSKGRVNLLPPRTNRHSSEEPVSNPPLVSYRAVRSSSTS
eukprot:468858-Hanusia_phi.AAC.2